jgi:DNA-directed RNA polymerase specialized sigma24 family protein
MSDDPLAPLVAGLAEPAARESAARALLVELQRRVRAPRLQPADREELVQRVVVRLLSRPLSHVGNVTAYVTTMLENAVIDHHRRRRRAPLVSDAVEEVAVDAHEVTDDGARRETARRFERLIAGAVSLREARYRDDLEHDLRQLLALATHALSLDEALEGEGVERGADPGERKRAQARLAKRHQRAREALDAAIDDLAAKENDPEEIAAMRTLRSYLLRCQRRPASAVEKSKDQEVST